MKTLSLLMPCTRLCNYTASYKDIYDHFTFGHQHSYSGERPMHDMFTSGISFILKLNINNKVSIMREHGNSLLFSVQCFRELYGVYVSICCIAPSSPEAEEFSYYLSYTMGGQTIIHKSLKVKRIRKVRHQIPQDNFMLIPQSLLHGELLDVEASINRMNQVQKNIV